MSIIVGSIIGALALIYKETGKLPGRFKDEMDKTLVRIIKRIVGVSDRVDLLLGSIHDRIEEYLEKTDKPWLKALSKSLDDFVGAAYLILTRKSAKGAIVDALLSIYDAMTGTAGDITELMFIEIDGVYKRIDMLRDEIKPMIGVELDNLLLPLGPVMEMITGHAETVMSILHDDVEIQITDLRGNLDTRLSFIHKEVDVVATLSADVKHFMEMFTKAMEV